MGLFNRIGPGNMFKMMGSFLNPDEAYKKAGETSERYYNQAQGQLQPYANQGQQAYGGLNTAMQALLNPAQLQDEWASGYETSPYAKLNMELAQNQGLDAASSMGLMGSSPALKAIQAGTSQIGMADRDRYLDSLMQKYMAGADMAQNIYGQGANFASQMGQNTMSQGQNRGQTAYGQAAAPGAVAGNLLGMLIAAKTGGAAGRGSFAPGGSQYQMPAPVESRNLGY